MKGSVDVYIGALTFDITLSLFLTIVRNGYSGVQVVRLFWILDNGPYDEGVLCMAAWW